MPILSNQREWGRQLASYGAVLLATGVLAYLGVMAARTALMDAAMRPVLTSPDLPAATVQARLQRAIRLRPDLSEPWRMAANQEGGSDPEKGRELAAQAAQLEPDNWNNWRAVGMLEYQLGDRAAAQQAWQRAARLNTGFEAHFESANLAYLLGDTPGFWREMKTSLRLARPGDVVLALQAAIRLEGDDSQRLLAILPSDRADIQAAALDFMLQDHHLQASNQLWDSISCPAFQRLLCQAAALHLVDAWQGVALQAEMASAIVPTPAPNSIAATGKVARTIRAGAAAQAIARALTVWNQAVQRRMLSPEPARAGQITDGDLQFPWIAGFAWQSTTAPPRLLPEPPPSRGNDASWFFSGDEPDRLVLLWQWMAVDPQQVYRFDFDSRASSPQQDGGIHLNVSLPNQSFSVASFADLSGGNGEWRHNQGTFTTPANAILLRVEFDYDRRRGEPPLQGDVGLRHLQMHLVSGAPLSRPVEIGNGPSAHLQP